MTNMLSQLLRKSNILWGRPRDLKGNAVPSELARAREKLMWVKKPIKEDTLQELTKDEADSLSLDDQYIYLPPLANNPEFIPILTVDCNRKESKMNFRVEMYKDHKEMNGRKRRVGIGVRFESPNKGESHNFWHAQLMYTTDASRSVRLPGCPEWIPDEVPCLPIAAKHVITFLICLVIAFYGIQGYAQMFTGMKIPGKYLRFEALFPGFEPTKAGS